MSATYKPGTVALVRCSDDEWRPAIAGERYGSKAWTFADGAFRWQGESETLPLIVLNPERCADPMILSTACAAGAMAMRETNPGRGLIDADALEWIAGEIERQTQPKPPEPTGDGAVVEDVNGHRWVRVAGPEPERESKPWRHRGHTARTWEHVNAIRVLSEGVQ